MMSIPTEQERSPGDALSVLQAKETVIIKASSHPPPHPNKSHHFVNPSKNKQSHSPPVFFVESKTTIGEPQTDVHGNVYRHNIGGVLDITSPGGIGGGLSKMNRTGTVYSLSASSTSSVESDSFPPHANDKRRDAHENNVSWGRDIRILTGDCPNVPPLNSKSFREAMEPHLCKARLMRESARNSTAQFAYHSSIASSVGVPYTRLRSECPFLFDVHTHPIHQVFAETLGVPDLAKIHEVESGDMRALMEPLLHRGGRRRFQEAYDSFVTSFCIPLLHSMAMSKKVFDSSTSSSASATSHITYRYQAFPSIRISRPSALIQGQGRRYDTPQGPHSDSANGHSIGFLQFHIPLTPSFGTNALYAESHPGREDWHPLVANSLGLGYLFDGARCLHFTMENTTPMTQVSMDFRIAIYREGENHLHVDGNGLCNKEILQDGFSRSGPGFYDEAFIDVGLGSPAWQIVAKKDGNQQIPVLLEPDHRVGFPFSL
jgi:hypothetical protein